MVCSLHAFYVLRLLCTEDLWKIMWREVTEKQWSRVSTIFSSSRCWNVNRICQYFSKNLDSSLSLLDDSFDHDIHFNSTNFVAIAVNLKSPSLQSTDKFGQLSRVPDPSIALQAPRSYHNLEVMVWWIMMDFHFVSFIVRFFYFWWWPPTLIPDKPRRCPWSHLNPGWFDRYLSTSWENFMEGKRVKLHGFRWFFCLSLFF